MARTWSIERNGGLCFDEFVQVEDADGRVFTVYSDIDKLENISKSFLLLIQN